MYTTEERRQQTLHKTDVEMQILEYVEKHIKCMGKDGATISFNLKGKWCTKDDIQN